MNPWKLVYSKFDFEQENLREALCTLGNGYFGIRGAVCENAASKVHYPGMYMAGVYNTLPTEIGGRPIYNEDFVNCPNWLLLNHKIGRGSWFDRMKVKILSWKVELNLKKDTAMLTKARFVEIMNQVKAEQGIEEISVPQRDRKRTTRAAQKELVAADLASLSEQDLENLVFIAHEALELIQSDRKHDDELSLWDETPAKNFAISNNIETIPGTFNPAFFENLKLNFSRTENEVTNPKKLISILKSAIKIFTFRVPLIRLGAISIYGNDEEILQATIAFLEQALKNRRAEHDTAMKPTAKSMLQWMKVLLVANLTEKMSDEQKRAFLEDDPSAQEQALEIFTTTLTGNAYQTTSDIDKLTILKDIIEEIAGETEDTAMLTKARFVEIMNQVKAEQGIEEITERAMTEFRELLTEALLKGKLKSSLREAFINNIRLEADQRKFPHNKIPAAIDSAVRKVLAKKSLASAGKATDAESQRSGGEAVSGKSITGILRGEAKRIAGGIKKALEDLAAGKTDDKTRADIHGLGRPATDEEIEEALRGIKSRLDSADEPDVEDDGFEVADEDKIFGIDKITPDSKAGRKRLEDLLDGAEGEAPQTGDTAMLPKSVVVEKFGEFTLYFDFKEDSIVIHAQSANGRTCKIAVEWTTKPREEIVGEIFYVLEHNDTDIEASARRAAIVTDTVMREEEPPSKAYLEILNLIKLKTTDLAPRYDFKLKNLLKLEDPDRHAEKGFAWPKVLELKDPDRPRLFISNWLVDSERGLRVEIGLLRLEISRIELERHIEGSELDDEDHLQSLKDELESKSQILAERTGASKNLREFLEGIEREAGNKTTGENENDGKNNNEGEASDTALKAVINQPITNTTEGYGGIDLDSAMMNLEIKRDGNGMPLPAFQQPVFNINLPGLTATIIKITPVINLFQILGMIDPSETDWEYSLDPMDKMDKVEPVLG